MGLKLGWQHAAARVRVRKCLRKGGKVASFYGNVGPLIFLGLLARFGSGSIGEGVLRLLPFKVIVSHGPHGVATNRL